MKKFAVVTVFAGALVVLSGGNAAGQQTAPDPAPRTPPGPAVNESGTLGAQWTNIGPPGDTVGDLVIDSTSLSVLYAGTAATGVSKSRDGGATWAPANNGLITPMRRLVMDPFSHLTILALSANTTEHPFELFVYKTTNGGGSWQSASTGLPDTILIKDLAISEISPGLVFATFFSYATGKNGLYRSTNGAKSWTSASRGLEGRQVGPIVTDPFSVSTAYVGTDQGPFKTVDGGNSWVPAGQLPSPGLGPIALDPHTPGTLYVSSFDEAFKPGGFFKSQNGGATWTALTGLPFAQTPLILEIVVPRGAPGRIYATAGNQIFWSDNGGLSWSLIEALPAPHNSYAIAGLWVAPGSPATLYVKPFNGNLWRRSIDAIPAPCDRCPRTVPFY